MTGGGPTIRHLDKYKLWDNPFTICYANSAIPPIYTHIQDLVRGDKRCHLPTFSTMRTSTPLPISQLPGPLQLSPVSPHVTFSHNYTFRICGGFKGKLQGKLEFLMNNYNGKLYHTSEYFIQALYLLGSTPVTSANEPHHQWVTPQSEAA